MLLRVQPSPLVKGIVVGLFIVSFSLTSWRMVYYRTRFLPGTTIAGKSIAGLTRPEAEAKLGEWFVFHNKHLAYTHNGKNYFLPTDFASLNSTSTLNTAWPQGRSLLYAFSTSKRNFPLSVVYDRQVIDNFIATLSAELDKPFVPAALTIQETKTDKTISFQPGTLGQLLDKHKLANELKWNLAYYLFEGEHELPVDEVGQLPDGDAVAKAQANALQLVAKKVQLTTDDAVFPVEDQQMLSFIGFAKPLDEEKIEAYIEGLSSVVSVPAQDAVFRFENGRVLEFKPAKNGKKLLVADSKEAFVTTLAALLATNPEATSSVSLLVQDLEPTVTTEEVNNLGIKELLGKGDSSFVHSIAARLYNIERGSSVVNGVLVPPGEIFSFNTVIGEVSQATGYKSAYIIRAGKTELGDGGGVCQVSTTLFRAILNAGLPIIERRPHAYRVSYYEEDSKPGFDATVFQPSPDLKFQNDTGHHLLIQSTYDGVKKHLTYEIYGTSDGRKVAISNWRSWDYSAPPPDVYIDDPTLPVGQVRQQEHRIPGLKTAFDWRVTRGDQVLHEQTFTSVYKAWQAVYLRGTKPL